MPRPFNLIAAMVGGLVLPLVAIACGSPASPPHVFAGTVIDPPKTVADFNLIDQTGADFRLSSEIDELSLIYFGYTYCPDICPMSLADMLNVKRGLGDQAGLVKYLMVSVDPERDTPEALANRLSVFDPAFVGLTGDRADLQRIWDDFGIYVAREETVGSAAGYLVAHTSSLYLVDDELRLRLVFPFGTAPEDMVADIQEILNQQS